MSGQDLPPVLAPSGTPLRKRNKRVLTLQLGLVGVFVVGVIWALLGALGPSGMGAPSRIGDMSLTKVVSGKQAVAQIEQLHGKEIGVTDGYLADYQAGAEHMTLWVGRAETESAAEALLGAMRARMKGGSSGFTEPVQTSIQGTVVFATTGGGGQNYFFRVSDKVAWVTLMDSRTPVTRVQEVLGVLD